MRELPPQISAPAIPGIAAADNAGNHHERVVVRHSGDR